jgi:hypothetical protein
MNDAIVHPMAIPAEKAPLLQAGRAGARVTFAERSPTDGIQVDGFEHRIAIQWRARDIHPWDRDLHSTSSTAFREQLLADTEAAILRLFEFFPELDVLDLRVIEPGADTTILCGTIHRCNLEQRPNLLSVNMRLRELGVVFQFAGSRFQSLDNGMNTA